MTVERVPLEFLPCEQNAPGPSATNIFEQTQTTLLSTHTGSPAAREPLVYHLIIGTTAGGARHAV
jgi:hypothetical protein